MADNGSGSPEADSAERASKLARVLAPRTIAVVGLSESNNFAEYIEPTLASEVEVHFVHPKHAAVFGRKTYASLSDIGKPIDAVMSVMGAQRTTELAEEAASLDVGGLVLIAGGFAEAGAEGAELQRRLHRAAARSGMAIVGPNGLGFVNVPRKISLTIASRHKRRPGGISVVSQSGAMLSGAAMAAWDRTGTGLNLLISAGNEVVTDLADYVDHLAADSGTRAIGLIVETVRRPEAFFAAVRRAMDAGKPVVALKLARNTRSQKMAASHTGALTGDAWVYDVAFAQAGIDIARDPEELIDRLSLVEQLDPAVWTGVERLGVVTMTGGFASLAVDIAGEESVDLPALEGFSDWLAAELPGVTVPNPLDTTGLGNAKWPAIVEKYAFSDELDSLMFIHPLTDEDETLSTRHVDIFVDAAERAGKPFVIANCSGRAGGFVAERAARSAATALGHGLRPTLRGLHTLGAFHRHRTRERAQEPAVPNLVRPGAEPVSQPEGPMLAFGAAMALLADAGIPVAPYALIGPGEPAEVPPFAGPYVAKLADVAHRTEHGAVRLNVAPDGLDAAVTELRGIADRDGLASTVAVQAMAPIHGEVFLGIQGGGELGPMVVFGLGGVFVEALGRIGGRMAPLGIDDARELVAEFADVKVMHGFRGKSAWDLEALARILVAAGRLAVGARDWLSSLDVNPLVYTGEGYLAVDALCLVRE